jgi:hypothetical protein
MEIIKILDLFSGTQSVRKALDLMGADYEYYGIDIYSPEEENIILDLAQDNIVEKVITALPKDWKPDFIWASPVCNKFSRACGLQGGNLYFEITKQGIKPRENMEPVYRSHYKKSKDEIKKETTLHLKLVDNMQKVIDYYNCDFVIENPRSSLMSYVLNPLYVKNNTDYCMYGFDYKKSTSIYSNYNLGLKKCNHKKHKLSMSGGKNNAPRDYATRSSVPPKLIEHIFNIFKIGQI